MKFSELIHFEVETVELRCSIYWSDRIINRNRLDACHYCPILDLSPDVFRRIVSIWNKKVLPVVSYSTTTALIMNRLIFNRLIDWKIHGIQTWWRHRQMVTKYECFLVNFTDDTTDYSVINCKFFMEKLGFLRIIHLWSQIRRTSVIIFQRKCNFLIILCAM